MNADARVFVAGGTTLLGAALIRRLQAEGLTRLVGLPPDEPDLTCPAQVEDFFSEARPEYVFVAAGKSGGIALNRARPAELMLDNLLVAAHVLPAAQAHGVSKLLYLASACAYPRDAAQPMGVEALLTGPVEPTSAAYATAKLAGWQLCRAFRQQYGARFVVGFPTNAFGPGDDFGGDSGHVVPALMRRAHEAKERGEPALTVWGSGAPRREFLHADDVADACAFVMRRYDGEAPINLGGGADVSVAELARAIADVVGYRGRLVFDAGKPDGAPRKRLDAAPLLGMGWRPRVGLREGLERTYEWFAQSARAAR